MLNWRYSDGTVESIRDQTIKWALRLRNILREASRLHDSIDDIYEAWPEFFAVFSLQHWNGFCHVQAIASPQAREVFRKLSIVTNEISYNGDYESDDEGAESLRTLSCFIQCLRFYRYETAAATLAVQAIICYLPVSPLRSDGGDSSTKFLLNEVRQCHNEIGVYLWGGDATDGDEPSRDPVVLSALLQAVVDNDDAWKIWCNSTMKCSTEFEFDDDCCSPNSAMVSLPLPVYVLLECIKRIPDDFQVDNVVQVKWLLYVFLNLIFIVFDSLTSLLNSTSCFLAQ